MSNQVSFHVRVRLYTSVQERWGIYMEIYKLHLKFKCFLFLKKISSVVLDVGFKWTACVAWTLLGYGKFSQLYNLCRSQSWKLGVMLEKGRLWWKMRGKVMRQWEVTFTADWTFFIWVLFKVHKIMSWIKRIWGFLGFSLFCALLADIQKIGRDQENLS